jgi:hypothetical protein
MSNTVTYTVTLAPNFDNVPLETVEVTGTSVDAEGDLAIYNNGTVAALFSKGSWLYVRTTR